MERFGATAWALITSLSAPALVSGLEQALGPLSADALLDVQGLVIVKGEAVFRRVLREPGSIAALAGEPLIGEEFVTMLGETLRSRGVATGFPYSWQTEASSPDLSSAGVATLSKGEGATGPEICVRWWASTTANNGDLANAHRRAEAARSGSSDRHGPQEVRTFRLHHRALVREEILDPHIVAIGLHLAEPQGDVVSA